MYTYKYINIFSGKHDIILIKRLIKNILAIVYREDST